LDAVKQSRTLLAFDFRLRVDAWIAACAQAALSGRKET